MSSSRYTLKFKRRIVQDVLEGKSVETVAALWGLDAQLIRTWVKEQSVVSTSGSRRPALTGRGSDDDDRRRDRPLGGRKAARKKISGAKKRARKAAAKKRARKATAKKSARKAAARKKR